MSYLTAEDGTLIYYEDQVGRGVTRFAAGERAYARLETVSRASSGMNSAHKGNTAWVG